MTRRVLLSRDERINSRPSGKPPGILVEISAGSKKVNDLVAEISAAVDEQSQGIKQVNDAVAQMDKVTQQNAVNSEESASSAEELNSQAEEMRRMVAEFKLTAGGPAGSLGVATVKKEIHHHDYSKPVPVAKPKNRINKIVKSGNGGGTKARATKAVEPELIIPMNEDDFDDF